MITRACYANRQTVMDAVEFRPGVDANAQADRAIESASEKIDRRLHAVFHPQDGTRWFDWPNQGGSGGGQYAYPWRLWLDQNRLACLTALSSGGTAISLDQVFCEPANNPANGRPWYDYLELDRSTSAAWTPGQTPQHSIAATGTWGSGADADQVAALAADATAQAGTITLDNGAYAGPGDLLYLGYGRGTAPFPSAAGYAGAIAPYQGERMLVTGVAAVSTGLTQSGAGCSTASDADQSLSVTGSGSLNAGEVLVLDSEAVKVESVTGGVATVRRAWHGTTLAAHSGAAVYAYRQVSVTRGMYGTAAQAGSLGDAVHKHRVIPVVRDLCVAEGVNQMLQEGSGYARTVGAAEAAIPAPGRDLAVLWKDAMTVAGRRARMRTV